MFHHFITTLSPELWESLKEKAKTRFGIDVPKDFTPHFFHINDFNLGIENPTLRYPSDLHRCYNGWNLLEPIVKQGRRENKIAVIQVSSIDDLQYLHPIQSSLIIPNCRAIT